MTWRNRISEKPQTSIMKGIIQLSFIFEDSAVIHSASCMYSFPTNFVCHHKFASWTLMPPICLILSSHRIAFKLSCQQASLIHHTTPHQKLFIIKSFHLKTLSFPQSYNLVSYYPSECMIFWPTFPAYDVFYVFYVFDVSFVCLLYILYAGMSECVCVIWDQWLSCI